MFLFFAKLLKCVIKLMYFSLVKNNYKKPWKCVLSGDKREDCYLKFFNFGLHSVSVGRVILDLIVCFGQEFN